MPGGVHPGTALRAVNERILDQEGDSFFCECGARRCTGRITIGRAEFGRFRQVEGARIVARGHWRRGERVIFATVDYLVVCD
jgi:hypothetical protein